MYRTGLCRFDIPSWIFLLATLFTFVQGGDDPLSEPRDVLSPEGARVLLSCGVTARGSAQWRFNTRAPLTPDHQLHDNDALRQQLSNRSLLIPSLSRATTGLYQCVVKDGARALLGRQARVAIAELPPFTPGRSVVSTAAGAPALLPCPLQTPPTTPLAPLTPLPLRRKHKGVTPTQLYLNVTWLRNGLPVLMDARSALTASGALEIDPTRTRDATRYACRVALVNAPTLHRTSDEIELRVTPELEHSELAPRFVTTPHSVTALEGSSVTFECAAMGNPKPEVVWLHNGVAIDLSDLDSRCSLSGSGSLLLRSARASDAGAYTCRAHSVLGAADHTAHLTVLTPPLTSLPSGAAASARQRGDVTLRCDVTGHPDPAVVWFKDGEPITPNGHDIALVDGSSLRILGVLPLDEGIFQCAADSIAGYSIAAITLTVTPDEPANNTKTIPATTQSSKYTKVTKHVPTHMNSTQDIFNSLISSSSLTDDILEPDDVDFLGETSSAYTQKPEVEFDKTLDSDLESGSIENRLDDFYEDRFEDELDLDSLLQANASTLSAPRDLHAALVKPRFVTLSWSEPEVAKVEVTGYLLLYKVNGSHRERVWSTSASQRSVNVASLQPNTTYSFSAIAISHRVASKPSAVIVVSTPPLELSYGPPRSLRVTATGPHSVTVSWAPPQDAQPDKYTVYYTEAISGREQIQWVEPLPSPTVTTTLSGLKAATHYYIRVSAAGGALSAETRVSTPGAAPAAPPTGLTAEAGDQSITVWWEPPPPRSHRGPLTGYTVRYRGQSGASGVGREQSVTTPADVRRVTLTGLEAGVTYQIRVCALNANGSGPWSAAIAAAPRAARDLAVAVARAVPPQPPPLTTRSGRDWISVWWSSPPLASQAVSSYTLGWGLGVPDDRTADLPSSARSHVIKSLEMNSEYVISLRAGNSVGLGPPVYATVRTKAASVEGDDLGEEELEGEGEDDEEEEVPPLIPPVGVKVIMLSGSTAVVYWTDPTLPKGQPLSDNRRYVVRWSAPNSKTRTFNASDLNAMIDDLRPFTTYEFAVKLIKGGRESAWSMLVSNTTLEAAPASPPLELRAAPPAAPANPARSVELHWAPPSKPNGVITGYVIMYAVVGSEEWAAVTSVGAATRARVDRLRPRSAYTFKVQARNSKGLGPVSAPVQYTTAIESGDGGGLAAATSAWLWASAGGALAVLALAAALALSLCCRRAQPPTSPPTSTYQKSSASAGIKPPDLWIHHDQMELRHTDKTLRDSHISANSTEGALASSSLTLGREYEPPRSQHTHHSLDTRTYVPTYVERGGSCAGSDDTALLRATPTSGTYYRCDYIPRPMTGMGVSSMGMMGVGGVGCSNTCDRRGHARQLHADQSTPLLSGVCPLSSPQPSLASLQPPPAPCGSGTCPLGSACVSGAGGVGGGVGAGRDVYASVSRERGHYVAYEPLGGYTHRDSLSSEGGLAGSATGTIGSSGPAGPGLAPGGPGPGPLGSLPRRAGPLHSFSDHSDHSTPTHSNRSVRESSPYKKSNSSSPGHTTNRLTLGGAVAHCPEELETLTPSHSTERLQREMQNLEGLMKDLSAITQHQFQC